MYLWLEDHVGVTLSPRISAGTPRGLLRAPGAADAHNHQSSVREGTIMAELDPRAAGARRLRTGVCGRRGRPGHRPRYGQAPGGGGRQDRGGGAH